MKKRHDLPSFEAWLSLQAQQRKFHSSRWWRWRSGRDRCQLREQFQPSFRRFDSAAVQPVINGSGTMAHTALLANFTEPYIGSGSRNLDTRSAKRGRQIFGRLISHKLKFAEYRHHTWLQTTRLASSLTAEVPCRLAVREGLYRQRDSSARCEPRRRRPDLRGRGALKYRGSDGTATTLAPAWFGPARSPQYPIGSPPVRQSCSNA